MDIQVESLPDKTPQSAQAAARGESVIPLVLANRFHIDIPTDIENKKLSEVWALAQGSANSDDIQDILWEVIHLEGVLGSPRLGESRLDRLYKYAKLKRQEAQIQTELKDVQLTGRLH